MQFQNLLLIIIQNLLLIYERVLEPFFLQKQNKTKALGTDTANSFCLETGQHCSHDTIQCLGIPPTPNSYLCYPESRRAVVSDFGGL